MSGGWMSEETEVPVWGKYPGERAQTESQVDDQQEPFTDRDVQKGEI